MTDSHHKGGAELVRRLLDTARADGISRHQLSERLNETARLHGERVYSESTLSKVFGGHLEPKPPLLTVIALYLGLGAAESAELGAPVRTGVRDKNWSTPHPSGQDRIRIGFGHCVWAAPLVAVALEERPAGYEFVSFGESRDPLKPHFFPRLGRVRDGTNGTVHDLNLEEYLDLDSEKDLPNPEHRGKMVSFSARDILKLLDRREIHLALVPWFAAEGRPYKRVATIVDSATGCSLIATDDVLSELEVIPPQNDPHQSLILSTLDVARRLARRSKKTTTYAVFAEPATVALNYALSIRDALKREGHRLIISPYFTCELARTSLEDLSQDAPHDSTFLGVIAWDPHATWLTQRSAEGARSIPLIITHWKWYPPQHLTFDLIHLMEPGSELSPSTTAVTEAAKKLLRRIRFQAENVRALAETREPSLLTSLMHYFAFPFPSDGERRLQHSVPQQERALQAISTVRFQVYDHVIDH